MKKDIQPLQSLTSSQYFLFVSTGFPDLFPKMARQQRVISAVRALSDQLPAQMINPPQDKTSAGPYDEKTFY